MKKSTQTQWLTRTTSDMTTNLWVAFAAGTALAAIVWLFLHLGSNSTFNMDAGDVMTPPVTSNGMQMSAQGIANSNGPKGADKAGTQEGEPLNIRVYLTKNKTIETVPLETYVSGVVAAEMPIEFEPAALEAQALAARTYIVRRLWLNDRSGVPVERADVTDTQNHQVYRSLSEMKQLAESSPEGWRKVDEAVKNTAGHIITYDRQPIEALYFSTSNGYTESSEEVFPAKLPYLRSVASPWDAGESPRAEEKVEMPVAVFYEKLGVKSITAGAGRTRRPLIRVLERTEGHRVKWLSAGSVRLTGEQVRDKLGLRSASFEWQMDKDIITLTVYGSGHGVGMSQWGAQGMAKQGKSAQQIVQHYYTGARIEEVSKLSNMPKKRL